jgi:enoyl-CoA hydratase/carnithine racemase
MTYMVASANASWAIPAVILGLAILAGGTWFFVHWNTRCVAGPWHLTIARPAF